MIVSADIQLSRDDEVSVTLKDGSHFLRIRFGWTADLAIPRDHPRFASLCEAFGVEIKEPATVEGD